MFIKFYYVQCDIDRACNFYIHLIPPQITSMNDCKQFSQISHSSPIRIEPI
ncbi:hypothetical protein M621_22055 [Serratia plymuthica S13]|uniref:Uncharacterized protein n=1 Tax=Serratia plymuthica S13 TaxID=1348660 RepID=S4YRB8_SERPL|nr:hypothetical protein M621_22055 [Serratia plymuthica S13]